MTNHNRKRKRNSSPTQHGVYLITAHGRMKKERFTVPADKRTPPRKLPLPTREASPGGYRVSASRSSREPGADAVPADVKFAEVAPDGFRHVFWSKEGDFMQGLRDP